MIAAAAALPSEAFKNALLFEVYLSTTVITLRVIIHEKLQK